ncbi:DUF4260 domain-containing protein [Methylomonas sp. AM2-LC]|uniref:DUF4260 domain-containing protein n=1 Tax=Methylomonas sp. AM2-LC TaxID=3153301 RepID=UPI0032673057
MMFTLFKTPIALLKLEGFAVFLMALTIYWQHSFGGWPLFWSTILVPDLAILGYLVNAQFGAKVYNITHSTLLPSTLALVAMGTESTMSLALALIWFVHIGFDRMLGYGLKYPEGFKVTHLGTI